MAGSQYPRSLGEFQAWFSIDADCLDYLEWLRWPDGFGCPDCGNMGGWRLADGRFRCAGCGARTSVTAGTIFDRTRTPLTARDPRALCPRARRRCGGQGGVQAASRGPHGRLAGQAMAAGHPPRSSRRGAPGQLPRGVRVPLQPPPIAQPRTRLLPRSRARRDARSRALPRPHRQPPAQGQTTPSAARNPRQPSQPATTARPTPLESRSVRLDGYPRAPLCEPGLSGSDVGRVDYATCGVARRRPRVPRRDPGRR